MTRKKRSDTLVKERLDEAICRDELEGKCICILHGMEKAMIGTTEVPRTREKNPTYKELLAWLERYNLMEACRSQRLLYTDKPRLTTEYIKMWARQDEYRRFLYDREFTEDVTCTVAVYERGLCIKCIADGYDDESIVELHKDEYSEEQLKDADFLYELKLQDAEEWFEYNTMGALPNAKEAVPVIVEGFGVDGARWEAFKQ